MSKFGDQSSAYGPFIRESYWQIGPNAGLGAGENLFAMPLYYPPVWGHVLCDVYAEVDWQGDQAPGLWLSIGGASSPAPNSSGDLGWVQPCAGVFDAQHNMRSHAVWYSQSPVVGIQAYARIYCTGGNVRCRYVGGFWRPLPT